ncbi:unnamed protein product [Porites evermanni]|uniref:Uncharacterized protein n=1 Tax=Porites evermanni TaxID=104178 RepID=A0ABN8RA93_9CNID|nr:unnamed protein product [Porites evermanni]
MVPRVLSLTFSAMFFVQFAATESENGINCSLMLLQSQKHSCGLVDKVTCGELGCCWNESETNSHLQCFSKRTTPLQNGTTLSCLHYEGQICRDIFSTNLSSLSSLPRLHSSEQNSVESVLQFAITAINQLVTHHECSVAMTIALCHYTMQLCPSNNSVTAHFCTSECNDLYVKCGQFILQLEEYVNNIPRDEEFSFPRCFELNNASEFRVSSNETCAKLGLEFSPFSSTQASRERNLPYDAPFLSAARHNCSAIQPEEKVGCVLPDPKNPNATVCLYLGCCWNQTEQNIKLKCFTKSGGTCMPYAGKICQESLNTTLGSYRSTPRFIDNKFGQLGTEAFLQIGTDIINSFVKKDDRKCRYIMHNMLCQYTLQPCYPDNTVVEYCKEDCEAIFRDCQEPLNQVIGAVKFHVQQNGLDFVHTGLPDCTRHKPAKYFDNLPNRTCIKTGFFNYTEEEEEADFTPPPDGDKLHIIIPLVVVGFLLIVVCLILFIFLQRRKKKRKDAVDNAHDITKKGSITMRDRLRAESLKSLDSRLLRLYDPNKLRQYPLDHVQYVRDLGEGFFGKVFQGSATGLIEKQPKKEVAVAVKALKDEPSKEQKDEFFREVTLMSILRHPNIVQLLAVSTEEEPYGMVFEFMSNGDLNQFLRNALPAETSLDSDDQAKVYLTQEDLVSISVQIATGMEYLAEMKFVHRDMAARNCLVGDNMVVKIADFGMSRDIYASEYYKMSKETLLPIRWLAPEAFLYGKFSLKSDVYAYGVVLWEIFTFGLQPYYGYTNKEVMEFIQKGIHLGKPDNCPDFIYGIMKDCWIREPEKRVQFTTISRRLKDPYHDYDEPPSDSEDGPEQIKTARPETGNYDIPRTPPTSNYDIPRASAHEGSYDVPRSYEDLTAEENLDKDGLVPRDIPV